MTVGSIIGPVFSGIGSLIGGIRAKKQAKEAEKEIKSERAKNRRWYEQQRNTNYLDTQEARSVLSSLRTQSEKQQEAMNNNLVRSGASDEAKVAAASELNKSYSENVNRLAGIGTRYQDNIRREYQSREDAYNNALSNIRYGKANAAASWGNIASDIGGQLSDLFDDKQINFNFLKKK